MGLLTYLSPMLAFSSWKATVAVSFSIVATLWLLASYVKSYLRLSHVKGPWLGAWSNLWWIRAHSSGELNMRLANACDKYGSLCRVGPNMLLTSDEELLRRMSAFRSPYTKSDWYKAFQFDPNRENLFSETDEKKHQTMRNKLTVGYSGKDNPTLEPDMDKVIWSFLSLIRSKYLSHGSVFKPVDFGGKLQFLTLDVITKLGLGEPLGWLENDSDMYSYIGAVADSLPSIITLSSIPALMNLMRIPAVKRAAMPTMQDRYGMGKIKAVANELIAGRFGDDGKDARREDMIQSFIERGLTQFEVADECVLQILAGSDTSVSALRAMVTYVTTNRRVYDKLRAECDTTEIPMSEIVSNDRAAQLPYLNAVVKETLRCHPPGLAAMPRVVPPEGDTWKGVYLPGGTEIGICGWKVIRDNAVHGPDANVFRPERWLEADAPKLAVMERHLDWAFGGGKYRCMGERIAKMEILKITFEVVRRFDLSLVDPKTPFVKSVNYGLWLQKGLMMRVEERDFDRS